jgi:GH15 family glucan-1,4-alpha-glucosidase
MRTLAVLLGLAGAMVAHSGEKRPWKGYSILGNGHLTAVYSDDARISAQTHATGIQHFYFRDYTADYIASTSFELTGQTAAGAVVGMKNFFTAETRMPLATILCFVHPNDAAVLSFRASAKTAGYRFTARLRNGTLTAKGDVAVAKWPNGTVIAIASKASGARVSTSRSDVVLTGAQNGEEVLLVPGGSEAEVLEKVRALRREQDLEASAARYWESWMNAGRLPRFRQDDPDAASYLEAYKRNLYCVKAANLNGQIPADITGQFVTNNMPQLYPRDAMMCARVLLATGHRDEARQVIEFWAKREIPMKTPGEWYARYDAHAKAVDAGTGARYDEPEWDANGYYIYLLSEYHRQTGVWLASREIFFELADFLVSHLSANGLLYEGGIVEWTGYLPATNMICAAASRKAADMAKEFGDARRADAYTAASQRISTGLPYMFDAVRQTYADVRFTGKKGANGQSLTAETGTKTYLWDTTANVGLIWGYPNHREIELSNVFYRKDTVKLDGGMQYFDSPDPGLAAYGHDVFFFTTAAASEYESLYGTRSAAKGYLDWMIRNGNAYGLMPERIHLDDSDCSPASPLSWCCAEFAAALLLWADHPW